MSKLKLTLLSGIAAAALAGSAFAAGNDSAATKPLTPEGSAEKQVIQNEPVDTTTAEENTNPPVTKPGSAEVQATIESDNPNVEVTDGAADVPQQVPDSEPTALDYTSNEATSGSDATTPSIAVSAAGPNTAKKLLGSEIQNPEGEEIAEIDDLVIGPAGEIQQVVLSVGGILGIGDEKRMVAYSELVPAGGDKEGVFMMNDADLKASPTYQTN